MKKIIIILLFSMYFNTVNSQTVNGVKIEKIPVRYVNLVVNNKAPYKIEVFLDYGQMTKLKDKNGYILDKDGERMSFNGIIKALNFLEKKGFKLISNSLNYTPFYTVLFENKNY